MMAILYKACPRCRKPVIGFSISCPTCGEPIHSATALIDKMLGVSGAGPEESPPAPSAPPASPAPVKKVSTKPTANRIKKLDIIEFYSKHSHLSDTEIGKVLGCHRGTVHRALKKTRKANRPDRSGGFRTKGGTPDKSVEE
jgi:hypothetical protein